MFSFSFNIFNSDLIFNIFNSDCDFMDCFSCNSTLVKGNLSNLLYGFLFKSINP